MRYVWLGIVSLSLAGCGGPSQPANTGGEAPSQKGREGEPAASEDAPGPRADLLFPPHEAVPPLAATCVSAGPLPQGSPCSDARSRLADALASEGSARDEALGDLEGCQEFPVGLVRALRAELGDPACADAFVGSVVGESSPARSISGDIRETLVALGLSGRLQRLAVNPPPAPSDQSKDNLEKYFKDELFPWISRQAQAIFVMASQGTRLSGYARGVVAIEAGNADMRFVEIARAAPLAKEISQHGEARDVYYATLDEQLEPRKARGRNAALVGLREMARLGVRTSPRVDSARLLLSKVYGGRRVNALDTLLVPDLPAEKAEDAASAIASRVPTAYAASLVGQAAPSVGLVRAHLQMGMPVGLRRQIEADGAPASRLLLARALFESGRTYFRSEDFQAVHVITTALLDAPAPAVPPTAGAGAPETSDRLSPAQVEEASLLRALGVALVAGPKDAADMIANGPRFADSLGNLAMLDGMAEREGALGGRAAFAAAYLRELVAPEGAPDYWMDLATRYRTSAKKLQGVEAKRARERGDACAAISRELAKEKKAK